jgi:hypothetical protein
MNLVARVKGILLNPSAEWQLIDQETHTVRELYLSYLLPLAALSALATLLGTMIFGYNFGNVSVRYGFGQALALALLGLVMTMVMAYVLAWIIMLLAPTFSGEKNFPKAFTVAAFSMTGALVGGFAAILPPPVSWLLGLLGGFYSFYLLYKGLPIVVKTPPDKALGYTVVVILAAIVCNVVLTALAASVLPNPWSSVGAGIGTGSGTGISIRTPAGAVSATQGTLEAVQPAPATAGKG